MSIYEEAQKDKKVATSVKPALSGNLISNPPVTPTNSIYQQAQADKIGVKKVITPVIVEPTKPSIFNKIGSFLGGIVEKIGQETANIIMPKVAYAPASEQDQATLQTAYNKSLIGKLSKAETNFAGNAISGFTGGIIKPEVEAPKDLTDKVIGGIGQALGTVASLKMINSGLNSIASRSQTVQQVLSKFPTASKYVYPFIQNAIGFDIYGQLDPDAQNRLGRLAKDTLVSVPFTALGFLPKASVSIPSSVALGYGLAKLDGASNEDAFISGAILGTLDAVGRIGGENTHFITGRRSDVILKSEASNVINEFSTIKVTPKSSPEEFQKAYREAARSTHPDLNPGQDTNFKRVNAAYQFLTGKSATLDLTNLSIKEQPVTEPDTYQQAQTDRKLIPAEQKPPKATGERITEATRKTMEFPGGKNPRITYEKEMRRAGLSEEQINSVLSRTPEAGEKGFYNAEDVFYGMVEHNLALKGQAKITPPTIAPLPITPKVPAELTPREKQLEAIRQKTLPEYNTTPELKSVDAVVDNVRELDPEKDKFLTDQGIKYEVTVSYPHSLGEMGNQTELIFKEKPTPQMIKEELLDLLRDKKAEINEELVAGITAKSARDEDIETAIDKVLASESLKAPKAEKKPKKVPLPKEEVPPIPEAISKLSSEKELMIQELESAETGTRYVIKDPEGYSIGSGASPSTFPNWIKEDTLRSTKLFEKVIKHLQENTRPKRPSTREGRLYQQVIDKIISNQADNAAKTQKERVSEAVKEEPKSIKQIAEETKILEPNIRRILGVGASEEFKVGDILDPQRHTNMEGLVTIREITGNTLKFTDAKGIDYAGMSRSTVRNLINEGSWKRIITKGEAVTKDGIKNLSLDLTNKILALRKKAIIETQTEVPERKRGQLKPVETSFDRDRTALNRQFGKEIYTVYKEKYGEYPIGFISLSDSPFDWANEKPGTIMYEISQAETDMVESFAAFSLQDLLDDLYHLKSRGRSSEIIQSDIQYDVEGIRPVEKQIAKEVKPSISSTIKADIEGFKEDVPIELGHLQELRPIEFPELVDMARELMGMPPSVVPKEKLRFMGGEARGLFIPIEKGKIKLSAELFKPENINQLSRTLAHELGHLTDYLPERLMKRGNILGRLFTLKHFLKSTFGTETGGLTKKDFTDIRKEVTREALKNNNISFGEWITGKVELEKRKSVNEEIKKLYNDRVKSVVAEKGLTSKKEIFDELMAVSKYWRPFSEGGDEKYIAYRNKPEELYADAISVLFNSPGTLERMAPKFYKEFFANLDRKPEVKDAYFEMQAIMSQDKATITEYRRKGVRQMFNAGDYKAKELEDLRLKEKLEKQRSLLFLLKFEVASRNAEIENKVAELKKKGVIIPDDENPLFYLREGNYMGGKMKAIIETKFQPIYDNLNKNDISWTDFGEFLFYERIIGGDRSDKANPRGLTLPVVNQNYEALKSQLGSEKFDLLRKSADEFRNYIKEINTAAYESGLYSKELYDEMQKNPAYASFKVIDHMEDGDTFKVFKQVGTLKDIVNPADATILKSLAVVRATERNNTTKSVVKFLEENYPDEISPAEKKFTGKAMRVIEPKSEYQRLATYYKEGKLEGSYVDPYISESLQRGSVGQNLAVIRAFRFMNGRLFRPLFITFNLGFQGFNLMRDFKRFYKVTPDLPLWRALKRYSEAARPAKIRAFGLPKNPSPADLEAQKLIQSMEMDKILSITFNDLIGYRGAEETQFEQVLRKYKVTEGIAEPLIQTKLEKILSIAGKPFIPILNFIERLGNLIETLPKVAAKYELGGKIPPRELRDFLRRNVGSPDFLDKGYVTPLTNEVFLFSNAIIQGIRSDFEIATNPKTRSGYWWKTFKIDFLPKILMFAAMSGLFGTLLKKMFDNVSEYDMTNYIIIPLGIDKNGKTIYIRMPHDETGRFLGGILWKTMNIFGNEKPMYSDLTDILSYTGGQLPSLSPIAGSVFATTQFISGQNPYDFFRGRNVLTDDELKSGGWDATLPFLKWQFEQLGGATFMKLYSVESTPTEKTAGERILSMPIISNVLGRYVKSSDYGQTEKMRNQLTPIQQEQAHERIRERQLLNDYIGKYQEDKKTGIDTYKELQNKLVEEIIGHAPKNEDEAKQRNQIIKKFKVGIIRGAADPQMNALISAKTTDEEIALIKEFKKIMDSEDFNELKRIAILQKITSGDTFIKAGQE